MTEQLQNMARICYLEKEQARRQTIAEWKESGQNRVTFYRERQISIDRFVYWKRKAESGFGHSSS